MQGHYLEARVAESVRSALRLAQADLEPLRAKGRGAHSAAGAPPNTLRAEGADAEDVGVGGDRQVVQVAPRHLQLPRLDARITYE